ncbi:tail protein X [Rhizobium laguerreae]|uniref:tail protein X n=1 Tax=Rhizobium laguerreae TaxID=1076926 RepID=UPI001C91F3DE|nr:tail protein X [Rhizobium laguerreae]MBY3434812.1 phage tail protein [Rhizobium laguerreae]MBY3448955.1 phage tail protein [Rhizobium laguerreae]MBY3456729.1 phage tail protein [Rhizobium laguerreae]
MATKYTTKQGQTVDLVCLGHYGRTAAVTELVLEANPGLAELGPNLPNGTVITLPEIETKPSDKKLVDLWV